MCQIRRHWSSHILLVRDPSSAATISREPVRQQLCTSLRILHQLLTLLRVAVYFGTVQELLIIEMYKKNKLNMIFIKHTYSVIYFELFFPLVKRDIISDVMSSLYFSRNWSSFFTVFNFHIIRIYQP